MSKSQLNNLSKRQILESLMYEQNQSNATLSNLITAVARTANLDPETLAKNFIDSKANQEYINKFNASVKASHAENHAQQNNPAVSDSETTNLNQTTSSQDDQTSEA